MSRYHCTGVSKRSRILIGFRWLTPNVVRMMSRRFASPIIHPPQSSLLLAGSHHPSAKPLSMHSPLLPTNCPEKIAAEKATVAKPTERYCCTFMAVRFCYTHARKCDKTSELFVCQKSGTLYGYTAVALLVKLQTLSPIHRHKQTHGRLWDLL